MSDSSVRATLDAWRESGADQLDPVRFRVIDALDRRAATYQGASRDVLDRKLAAWVERYRQDLEHHAVESAPAVDSARSALSDLMAHIATQTRSTPQAPSPSRTNTASDIPRSAITTNAVQPEVEVLDYFREVWEKLNSENQWRQFSTQVPENAGPLNTEKLMLRTLSLMRDVSPEYARQFLAYVNALSWMDRVAGDIVPVRKEAPKPAAAPRPAAARKSPRAKTR
ncbi:DUF2894 family protein [Pararobbsia alpina]|uniref:DUF2894 domain-containing protein n=1 Tax=Pararobbsia alpina TaxID=621374 RepID=UPI0039A6E3FD